MVAEQVAGLVVEVAAEEVAVVVAEVGVAGGWNKESHIVGTAVVAGEKDIACL